MIRSLVRKLVPAKLVRRLRPMPGDGGRLTRLESEMSALREAVERLEQAKVKSDHDLAAAIDHFDRNLSAVEQSIASGADTSP